MTDLRPLPDPVLPVLASADAVVRGEALRALLSPLAVHIARLTGATQPIHLFVVNAADWAELLPDFKDYDLPIIDPDQDAGGAIYMPAQFNERAVQHFAPPQGALSTHEVRQLLDRYGTVGIAHIALDRSGAHLPARWLGKIAALYITLGAERAADPEALSLWERWAAAWEEVDPAVDREQYSIETFEFLGTNMDPTAYFWIQAAIMRRALVLARSFGEGFVSPLLSAFAATGDLSEKEGLTQAPKVLDALSPGWSAWIATLRGPDLPQKQGPAS
jgi:hypothetical protein